MFVKPDGRRLQLLVRVPLQAMRDVDFPRRGIGIWISRAPTPHCSNAATLWIADNVELYEGEMRLAYPRVVEVRVSLPSDRSFASYEEALAHVTGPRLPDNTELYWNQVLFDVLFEYPIRSDAPVFDPPGLERLGCAWSPCFGSCRPAARCALTSSTAIPVWSGSIRDGIRRPALRRSWDSSTSWTAPTTCCSCFAW